MAASEWISSTSQHLRDALLHNIRKPHSLLLHPAGEKPHRHSGCGEQVEPQAYRDGRQVDTPGVGAHGPQHAQTRSSRKRVRETMHHDDNGVRATKELMLDMTNKM